MGNNIIINPPIKDINKNDMFNIPFCAAMTYAHTEIGINKNKEVNKPGENFRLTMVVPI
jgi:hypothetical protein